MITSEELSNLMNLGELDWLDFKAQPHQLTDEHKKSQFVKDILAMANTPRDHSAYIIVGVQLRQDGTKDLTKIDQHPDDADLHQYMEAARISPNIPFSYQIVPYQGLRLGVIEIPIAKAGPFLCTKRGGYGCIQEKAVYFRNGTQNATAGAEDIRNIAKWFASVESPPLVVPPSAVITDSWSAFLQACASFDEGCYYLWIVGPTPNLEASRWTDIARLPLSLVVDFDPDSASNGAFYYSHADLERKRSLHLWCRGDYGPMDLDRATYWYAARGLADRATTLVPSDWRAWNHGYHDDLAGVISQAARAAAGHPLVVVCLWYGQEYIQTLFTLVDKSFGAQASFVIAIEDAGRFQSLADQFGAKLLNTSLAQVLSGAILNLPSPAAYGPEVVLVPALNEDSARLEMREYAWLTEDLVLLHRRIAQEDVSQSGVDSFLRGLRISWRELDIHADADRDLTASLQAVVVRELQARTTSRVNLYHWPGSGGSTVARRVAWNLHTEHPVVLLLRIVPGETVERLRRIFGVTTLPILAIVEAAETTADALEGLYTELRAANVPVVFLQVLRRFDVVKRAERSEFLARQLSSAESARFADCYARAVPSRKAELDAIAQGSAYRLTPFEYALTAFDKEYVGLTDYVSSRLARATPVQKRVLVFLALAYYYGHCPLDAQMFARHLGLPESSPVRLERAMDEPLRELLVREADGRWRPSHHLVGQEILVAVLAGGADRRNWRRSLSRWALEFIDVCALEVGTPSERLLDVLRRVFILRDEHELLGTESSGSKSFSRLIDDAQSDEGGLALLDRLTDRFPGEAHFWAHLGRFYSMVMKEFERAREALQRAIRLAPADPVLRHMLGMCYREQCYSLMATVPTDADDVATTTDAVMRYADLALAAFSEARERDPLSEHSHISPIQLLLRVIDFGFRVSRRESRTEFLIQPSSARYREYLDVVEDLMAQTRSIRQGEGESEYVLRCQASLDTVYEDYSGAIQGWTNLLERRDVYAPPVRRQIAHAYLARKGRQWSQLSPREIARVVALMEENLREEPNSEHSIRLWFRAIRHLPDQSLDVVIDRVANWRASGGSIDSYFYLYVLHALRALDGSMVEQHRTRDLIAECAERARMLRNRTWSFEWLGPGHGLVQLVHQSELGAWDDASDFYSNISHLVRLKGRVSEIARAESGRVEISQSGLTAFFVPAKSNLLRGRDENTAVTFYLGFSYDGPRAWGVRRDDSN